MKPKYLLVTLLIFQILNGQSTVDSLKNYSYLELANKVTHYKKSDKKLAEMYANAYLVKAKKNLDSAYIGKAFFLKLTLKDFDEKETLKLLDSTIYYTKNSSDNFFPMLPLLNRGAIYDNNKEYKRALDDYLQTLESAKMNNQSEYFFIAKYNIATLKRRTGAYKEAEKIYNECLEFYSTKADTNYDYLLCLIGLSNIYYELNEYSKCTTVNKKGIESSLKARDSNNYYHFVANEGINLIKQEKFQIGIDSIKKALPFLKELSNQSVAYFYLGKGFISTKRKDKGISYFNKVDSIFNIINDLVPSIRQTYEYLIENERGEKNLESQLYYTNQLLRLDSVLVSDYKYLNNKIIKRFDIPELMEEKKNLIASLKDENSSLSKGNLMLFLLSIFSIILLAYFFKQKRVYKKRFDEIMKNDIYEKSIPTKENISKKEINIDQDIVNTILEKLEIFEKDKGFLENQLSVQKLATKIETNSKYLSKIINHFKEETFINYINNLRIDYVIDRLKNDKIFRKYTIKAISEESGFNSIDSFSRSFVKRTGLKPSYFIRNINH